MTAQGHVPVMRDEVLQLLAPRAGGVYLDGTFGGGGYAEAILSAAPCILWAIDRDPAAIARGASLAARFPERLHLIEGQFGSLLDLLSAHGVSTLDGRVSMQVTELHRAMPALLDALGRQGVPLTELRTRSATLEDVFVALTGRHLRDE